MPSQWRHNEGDGVSNHQPHDCLLNRLFRRRSKKTSKLRATGLCDGNSSVTDEFPAQRTCNAENVSIWWRHHALVAVYLYCKIPYHHISDNWKTIIWIRQNTTMNKVFAIVNLVRICSANVTFTLMNEVLEGSVSVACFPTQCRSVVEASLRCANASNCRGITNGNSMDNLYLTCFCSFDDTAFIAGGEQPDLSYRDMTVFRKSKTFIYTHISIDINEVEKNQCFCLYCRCCYHNHDKLISFDNLSYCPKSKYYFWRCNKFFQDLHCSFRWI